MSLQSKSEAISWCIPTHKIGLCMEWSETDLLCSPLNQHVPQKIQQHSAPNIGNNTVIRIKSIQSSYRNAS